MPGCPQTLLERVLAAEVDEQVLRAMSVPQRRYTLYYLLDEERASLDELADAVAGWMTVAHGSIADREDRDQLRTALYHTHLPMMADAGLVALEDDGSVVESALSEPARELVEVTYLVEHDTCEEEP